MLYRPYISRRGLLTGAAAAALAPRDAQSTMTYYLNPSDKGSNITLSKNNYFLTKSGTGGQGVRVNFNAGSGKYVLMGKGYSMGWVRSVMSMETPVGATNTYYNIESDGEVYRDPTGYIGNSTANSGAVFGEKYYLTALDLGAGRAYFKVLGGSWVGATGSSADPAAGTGGYDVSAIISAGNVYPVMFAVNSTDKGCINLGQVAPWETLPSGYSMLQSTTYATPTYGFDPTKSSTDSVLDNNNRRLTASSSTAGGGFTRMTQPIATGAKIYLEVDCQLLRDVSGAGGQVGVIQGSIGVNSQRMNAAGGACLATEGVVNVNSAASAGTPFSNMTTFDIIGMAISEPAKKFWFNLNGTWDGNPSAGTGGYDISSIWSGSMYPAVNIQIAGAIPYGVYFMMNDGTDTFANATPGSGSLAGFVAYKNMQTLRPRQRGIILP